MPGLLPVLVLALAAGILSRDVVDTRLGTSPQGIFWWTAWSASWLALAAHPARRARSLTCLVLAAAGIGWGALGAQLDLAARARPEPARATSLEARVVGRSEGGAPGSRWLALELGETRKLAREQLTPPARVRLRTSESDPEWSVLAALSVGERVRVRLHLRPIRGRVNPGSRDWAPALRRRGVGAEGRLAHPSLLVRMREPGAPPPRDRLARLRRDLRARLEREGPGGPLLAALALGARDALADAHRRHFKALGLAHLLAVSGLHLGLVTVLAWSGGRRLLAQLAPLWPGRDLRSGAVVLALSAAGAYAVLTGPAVPVQRAWLCLLATCLGWLAGRRTGVASALSLAAGVVLVAQPGALFEVGFQLSFVATAALALALPAAQRTRRLGGFERVWAALSDTARATATASAATLPVLALHGLSPAPWGVFANLAMVPWTALVLLPASLLAACAAAVEAGAPPLIGPVIELAERIAWFTLEAVASAASWLPEARLGRAQPARWALLLASVLCVLALGSRRTRSRCLFVTAAAVCVTTAPSATWSPLPPRLVVFDLGAADAILVEGRRGSLLVDTGRRVPGRSDQGASVVLPGLSALGVARLDVLAITHADLDHRGGAEAVLEGVPVGELWLPRGARAEPGFASLRRRARVAGVRVRELGSEDGLVSLGDLEVEPLWPPGRASLPRSRNATSLALRVEVGGVHALLTGDLDAAAERALVASGATLEVDVLQLPHHGSNGSSTPELLAATGARLGFVSGPCPGASGLPGASSLARARRAGLALAWTGRDGALRIGLTPELRVRASRRRPACVLPQP